MIGSPGIEIYSFLAYEKIYEGYPHIIYQNLNKLLKLMRRLRLDAKKEGERVLSYVHWVKCAVFRISLNQKIFQPLTDKFDLSDFAKEKISHKLVQTTGWQRD